MQELFNDIINSGKINNIEETKILFERCNQLYERLDICKLQRNIRGYRYTKEELNKILKELLDLLDDKALEKYLTPEKIQKYKFSSHTGEYMLMRLSPEKIDEFLTPEIYRTFGFNYNHLRRLLIRMGEDISKKYFFQDKNFSTLMNAGYSMSHILGVENVIKSMGKQKIKEYLTLENIKKFKLTNKAITKLINELEKEEQQKYIFQNQEDNAFSVANIIKTEQSGKIEEYLTLDTIKEFSLNDNDIHNLIGCLDEPERKKYLIQGQEDQRYGVLNIYYYHSTNPKKRELIEEFYRENQSAFKDSYSILDNDYIFEKFDMDMISYISCFKKESEELATSSNMCLDVIAKLLEKFQIDNHTDEWMYLLDVVLKNINHLETIITKMQLNDVTELDDRMIENLTKMMINGDINSKTNENDLRSYEQSRISNLPINYESFIENITSEEYDFYNLFNVKEQVNLLLISKFGITYNQAQEILEEYGDDISSIQNNDLKLFVKSIQMLFEFNRENNTQEIYIPWGRMAIHKDENKTIISSDIAERLLQEYGDNIEDIENENLRDFVERLISKDDTIIVSDCLKNIAENVEAIPEDYRLNSLALKKQLKKEYMKLYLPTFLSVEDCEKSSGDENIYELPTDSNGDVRKFNILLTSIAAFRDRDSVINDYFDQWNRPDIHSLHFCSSYIGREMLSLAPIPHICFGFNNVTDDSLLLSSNADIGSSDDKMASTSLENTHYYNPKHQIDRAQEGGGICECVRNEMDIRRNVNGHRIQPDYIVVFRTNGMIKNMDKAKKAQNDFKQKGINLPIIIVDRNKCLEAEKHEIDEMKMEYNRNPSKKLQKKINTKIMTNNHTLRYIQEAEDIPIEFFMGNEIPDTHEEYDEEIDKNHSIVKAMKECAEMTTLEQQTQIMSRFVQLKNIFRQERTNEKQH